MIDIVPGIIVVLICSVFFFFLWKQAPRNKNIPRTLFILLFCGFLLRLFTASDPFLHSWDERYHALVAKNLIEHPLKPTLYDHPILDYDYKNWSGNHVWLHKPPVPLWSMAMSLYLFGDNEIALRLPSIIISTIAIYLTFQIALFFFNYRIAIVAAFLHSIHGLIIEITAGRVATDHIDIFFLFFIELAVFLAIRFQSSNNRFTLALMGLVLGLALLTKWLPALIVLPIWFFVCNLYLDKGLLAFLSDLALILIPAIIVVLPWHLYIHHNFPLEAAFESTYNTKHFFMDLEGHGHPFYYHLDKIRMIYGELIYLPLLWWIWLSAKKFIKNQDWKLIAISCWVFIPLVFFSLAKTKLQAYTLFTAPALFMITAAFFYHLKSLRPSNSFRKRIIQLIAILLILLPIRYSIERIKPFSKRKVNTEWKREIKEIQHHLMGEETIVVFNVYRPIETMFYCDHVVAYGFIPSKEQINLVHQKGYKAYLKNEQGAFVLLEN